MIETIITIALAISVIIYSMFKSKPVKKDVASEKPKKSKKGFVYVISNPCYREGIFKIGLTTNEVDIRKKQLFTTGVPTPFHTCMVIETEDCHELEKSLHDQFRSVRINDRREWFFLNLVDINKIYSDNRKNILVRDDSNIKSALGRLYTRGAPVRWCDSVAHGNIHDHVR